MMVEDREDNLDHVYGPWNDEGENKTKFKLTVNVKVKKTSQESGNLKGRRMKGGGSLIFGRL